MLRSMHLRQGKYRSDMTAALEMEAKSLCDATPATVPSVKGDLRVAQSQKAAVWEVVGLDCPLKRARDKEESCNGMIYSRHHLVSDIV